MSGNGAPAPRVADLVTSHAASHGAFAQTVLEATPGLRATWSASSDRGADFARKFDATVDSAVIDALDRVIGPR